MSRERSEEGVQRTAATASGPTVPGSSPPGTPAVSDADVDAFHETLYARSDELEHIPVAPITNDLYGERWREALKRAIAADRKRAADR